MAFANGALVLGSIAGIKVSPIPAHMSSEKLDELNGAVERIRCSGRDHDSTECEQCFRLVVGCHSG